MIRLESTSIGSHFGEAHSLFFEFLATTGVVGLAMLLACMVIFPSMLFMGWRRPGGIKNLIKSPASLHGLCLILTFSSFGISQNWLGRSSITSVFFLLLALLWADVVRERQNEICAREAPGL
jgi:O-antigen ligase